MPEIKVTVTGMDGLSAAFAAAKAATSGKMLENAALAGAMPVRNAAKQKAPKKTSNLRRSIHTEVASASETAVEVLVGTDVEYAAIQEFGGTIVPKNAKYLAIPLTGAAEAAVSPRNFPGDLKPRIKPGGGGVLVDSAGTAQYALTGRVKIPPHPYLRPALDENVEKAKAAMGRALAMQLQAAK